MARSLDGTYDVRRYGRPGQAQHGLDVVGFFAERAPSVYQAKHWQAFSADDLEKAVKLYTGGRQPFGARRIVIAVATEARDTTIVEMLDGLRAKQTDMGIELWDRQEISDRLRNHPRLVTTFFGAATAAAFCGTRQPAIAVQTSIPADAILRGPVAHLGLADDLARAEETIAGRPDEAARLLDHVADRLESSGFIPHAAPVRALQATALNASGRRSEEAWLRIDVGWRHLHAGDPFSAGVQVQEIAKWGDDTPEDIARCTNALAAAVGVRRDYLVTLGHLAEAIDALMRRSCWPRKRLLLASQNWSRPGQTFSWTSQALRRVTTRVTCSLRASECALRIVVTGGRASRPQRGIRTLRQLRLWSSPATPAIWLSSRSLSPPSHAGAMQLSGHV
jgi:hypothetical protein